MIESAYLAGPMRWYPRYNFDAFEAAYQDLVSKGIDVISPHRMDLDLGFDPDKGLEEQGFKVEDAALRDINAIIKQQSVIFLPAWRISPGARAEYYVAQWLQRPCYKYPDLSPEYYWDAQYDISWK